MALIASSGLHYKNTTATTTIVDKQRERVPTVYVTIGTRCYIIYISVLNVLISYGVHTLPQPVPH